MNASYCRLGRFPNHCGEREAPPHETLSANKPRQELRERGLWRGCGRKPARLHRRRCGAGSGAEHRPAQGAASRRRPSPTSRSRSWGERGLGRACEKACEDALEAARRRRVLAGRLYPWPDGPILNIVIYDHFANYEDFHQNYLRLQKLIISYAVIILRTSDYLLLTLLYFCVSFLAQSRQPLFLSG